MLFLVDDLLKTKRFMLNFLICLLAYPNVRTESQSDIGYNRGKKVNLQIETVCCCQWPSGVKNNATAGHKWQIVFANCLQKVCFPPSV